jgi:hypothetical protein
MSEDGKAKGWWHTLPGVITAVTATVTALTGLVVAINQTGWFGARTPASVSRPAPAAVPAGPTASASPAPAPPSGTSAASPPGSRRAVGLPAMRDYRLGDTTFTLLQAEVSPRTSEKDELRLRVRMMNHQGYDTNFWDSSFRLIVDGVPMAPVGGLNEVVAGRSAKDGDVLFVVPRGTPKATLRITHANDGTDVGLDLQSSS